MKLVNKCVDGGDFVNHRPTFQRPEVYRRSESVAGIWVDLRIAAGEKILRAIGFLKLTRAHRSNIVLIVELCVGECSTVEQPLMHI